MNRIGLISAILASISVSFHETASAGPIEISAFGPGATRVNFDSFSNGTVLTNQLSSLGVTFTNAYVRSHQFAVSPPNVIHRINDNLIPIDIVFNPPVFRAGIQIDGDGYGSERQPQFSVFDTNGIQVGVVSFAQGPDFAGFEWAPGISRIRLCALYSGSGNCQGSDQHDNLIFEQSCAVANPDCNSNGISDSCDISNGFSQDCNNNGVPDECDIVTGINLSLPFSTPIPGTIRDATGLGTGFTHRLPGTGSALPANDPNMDLSSTPGLLRLTSTRADINQTPFSNLPQLEAPGLYVPGLGTGDFVISGVFRDVRVPNGSDQLSLYVGTSATHVVRAGIHNTNVYILSENQGSGDVNHFTGPNAFATGDDVRLSLSRAANQWTLSWQNLTNPAASGALPSLALPWLDADADLYVGVIASNAGTNTSFVGKIDSFSVIGESGGGGQDCNHNGIPDECELDSDQDGVIDACDNCLNAANPGQENADGDSAGDACDGCPSDPMKLAPGQCGCGVADTDSDGDGVADCVDGCPRDPNKVAPGQCGCGVADTDSDGDGTADCNDGCPNDPNKTNPGICGCGVADSDSDGDGAADCKDGCPNDPDKVAPGQCGCGVADTDSDGDGTADCNDGCPQDPLKISPGVCGCGVPDTDTDGDGTADCLDGCPADPDKVAPGQCGCGVADTDSDGDGTADCNDGCPLDSLKISPGVCGCGVSDVDSDGDGVPDCIDNCAGAPDVDSDGDGVLDCNDGCPIDANKTAPGQCGCGVPDTDSDGDGVADCVDGCPTDPNKTSPGICGCGTPDVDTDGDGSADCVDGCPNDPHKIIPGQCGCGIADTDTDGDGTADCNDGCPNDPAKASPGDCGCGHPDTDTDGDGRADCIDNCPAVANSDQADGDGDGVGDACDTTSVIHGELDIRPGTCPNRFNRNSNGVLPVALAGSPQLNVTQIILSTIRLMRADGVGGQVAPNEGPPGPHSTYGDVTGPTAAADCVCESVSPDGITDLKMHFRTQAVTSALQLGLLSQGATVQLKLTASLTNGQSVEAFDCIVFVPGGTPPGALSISSDANQIWVGTKPPDLQSDDGGFGEFLRTYPIGSAVTLTASNDVPNRVFAGWRVDGVPIAGSSPRLDVSIVSDSTAVHASYVTAIRGDANHDGALTVDDVAGFVSSLLALPDAPTPMLLADLDCDGLVNGMDTQLLVERLMQP